MLLTSSAHLMPTIAQATPDLQCSSPPVHISCPRLLKQHLQQKALDGAPLTKPFTTLRGSATRPDAAYAWSGLAAKSSGRSGTASTASAATPTTGANAMMPLSSPSTFMAGSTAHTLDLPS